MNRVVKLLIYYQVVIQVIIPQMGGGFPHHWVGGKVKEILDVGGGQRFRMFNATPNIH